jgi:hypothetical protein
MWERCLPRGVSLEEGMSFFAGVEEGMSFFARVEEGMSPHHIPS